MYSVFLMGLILSVQAYSCGQVHVQRQLSMKSLKLGRMASLVSAPMVILFHLLCCLCGLILYVHFKKCDPMTSLEQPINSADQLIPYFITSTMGQIPGLSGLCIAGIFSASLSVISAAVNSLAAVTYEDFIRPTWTNLQGSVFITKIASVLYGALIIFMAFLVASMGNLVKASFLVLGIVTGPSLGVFCLGALTTTANKMGANLGALAGFFTGCCLTFVPNTRHYPTLPVGKNCSSLIANILNKTPSYGNFEESQTAWANHIFQATTQEAPGYNKDDFPVSYMWINPMTLVITVVAGYFGSVITSYYNGTTESIPATLLSPVRRRFLKKESIGEVTKKTSIPISQLMKLTEL